MKKILKKIFKEEWEDLQRELWHAQQLKFRDLYVHRRALKKLGYEIEYISGVGEYKENEPPLRAEDTGYKLKKLTPTTGN